MPRVSITGREIIDRYSLSPYDLVLLMGKGLSALSVYGEPVDFMADLMTHRVNIRSQDIQGWEYVGEIEAVKNLSRLRFHESVPYNFFAWPKDIQELSFCRMQYAYALTPDRFKTAGGINKKLFFEELESFTFDPEEVAEFEERGLLQKGITASHDIVSTKNEAVDASNEGKMPNSIKIVEAFLEQNNIALEESQRQAIRAVVLRLSGKTNAQVFKELCTEAPFRTDHKGRGSKMVIAGLAVLRDNGVDITL